MRNSSIYCAATDRRFRGLAAALVLLAGSLALPEAAEGKRKERDYEPELLIQPFLGPEYAQWLIGPIARIASDKEIEAFLSLQDDAAAESFIDEFWARRDPFPDAPGNPRRDLFDERAKEVDSLYGETLYRGRHTDRGTLYVLYGPPEKVEREVAPYYGGEAIEVWIYPKDPEPGLDGQKPKRAYRFLRDGDRTIFYDESIVSRRKKAADRIPRPPGRNFP